MLSWPSPASAPGVCLSPSFGFEAKPANHYNPPIGLYILILTAVSHKCQKSLVLAQKLNAYSQVECMFMLFRDGTCYASLSVVRLGLE
jgi:hypothetical protein